ncbi:MAG: DUF4389 domain-containing protein [Candidatus Aenigmatarchaeota archaeon]
MVNERSEALFRIVVAIVSGIVLGIWRVATKIVAVVHWFIVLITKKRDAELALFCNRWNVEYYRFIRYLTFVTNKRPFPFEPLSKKVPRME